MMRAALVGTGTVVGVGAVLALNPTGAASTSLSIPLVAAGPAAQNGAPFGPAVPTGEPSTQPTATPSPHPHASGSTQHASKPVTSTPRPAGTQTGFAPAPNAAPTHSTAPKPAPSPTPRATPSSSTATGPAVDVGYGQFGVIQVQATVSGGRIVDIEPVQLPDYEQTSVLISEQAWPILKQEALQAQSSQIANVTGASFTTQGFEQSLRAALLALGHSA